MNRVNEVLVRPCLREGVHLELGNSEATLTYRAVTCTLRFDSELHGAMRSFFKNLEYNRPDHSPLAQHTDLVPESAERLLRELDAMGMVTERRSGHWKGVVTGAQAARELKRFIRQAKAQLSRSIFYKALESDCVTSRQLIGYAVEYFHIVRAFPMIGAAAIGRTSRDRDRDMLCDYFISEVHHDRLLARALQAVGVDDVHLAQLVPLPATFALIASMSAYARYDWTTFRGALWLFEEPSSEFTLAFARQCDRVGLPKAFSEPIIAHADVNESEKHGSLPDALFVSDTGLASEVVISAKKNIFMLLEMFNRLELAILSFYARTAGAPAATSAHVLGGMNMHVSIGPAQEVPLGSR